MHGVIALLARKGMNSLLGMRRGGETLYIKTCTLKIHCQLTYRCPYPYVSVDSGSCQIWENNVGCKRLAVRVSHISGQGAWPPFGLDPLPYVDSASRLRVVRLFCVARGVLQLSILVLCRPRA
jgi:hypothetical protein